MGIKILSLTQKPLHFSAQIWLRKFLRRKKKRMILALANVARPMNTAAMDTSVWIWRTIPMTSVSLNFHFFLKCYCGVSICKFLLLSYISQLLALACPSLARNKERNASVTMTANQDFSVSKMGLEEKRVARHPFLEPKLLVNIFLTKINNVKLFMLS